MSRAEARPLQPESRSFAALGMTEKQIARDDTHELDARFRFAAFGGMANFGD
jgi:hypothetical protein